MNETKSYRVVDCDSNSGKYNLHYGFNDFKLRNYGHKPKLGLECLSETYDDPNYAEIIQQFPGFFDIEWQFYRSPILVGYIEIISHTLYIRKKSYQQDKWEVLFRIYNQDFSDYRTLKVENDKYSLPGHAMLTEFINTLNEYVHRGFNIDQLHEGKLKYFDKHVVFGSKSRIDITNALSFLFKLSITVYEYNTSPRGQDGKYWKLAIIKNIPSDRYLYKLLVAGLKKHCHSINENIENNQLEVEFDYDPNAIRELIDGKLIEYNISGFPNTLNQVILTCANEYDSVEYMLDSIQK
ncbi:MAG: hypothetical protein CMP48_25545 [Rickettsiales bacterium]|nr:hypothetical protein [Rickettsiales bacterium]MBR11031.1 hypothetical protein [Rickettsiales bacterium]